MKDKSLAAILAIFLGHIGIHWFYLGKTMYGVLHLLFCWTFIPSLIALINFFQFIFMSQSTFDAKYNRDRGIVITRTV